MKPTHTKISAIDVMRTFSILAVILIHTTTKTLELTHYDLKTYWPDLLLNQTARFAVPLFFMVSGFVLEFNYREKINLKAFFLKRMGRVLIPYIFWSFIYFYFVYTNNNEGIFYMLLKGNASYQFYFIPAICMFYFIYPLLHYSYRFISSLPVLGMLTYLQITLMNQDYLVRQFSFADPIRIFILGYLFFILGMVAAKNYDLIKNISRKLILPLAIAAVYLSRHIYLEGLSRYYQTYNIGSFYSQWRADILLYTILIFLILANHGEKKNQITNIIKRSSKLSYFVFFVHVMVLEAVWELFARKIFISLPTTPPVLFIFGFAFFGLVGLISFAFAYLIHRHKFLKIISG